MYPAQQNATDSTANFVWLILITVAVFILLWIFCHDYIVSFIFFIRHLEMLGLEKLFLSWNFIAEFLHLPLIHYKPIVIYLDFIKKTPIKEVKFQHLKEISVYVGSWYRYLTILILLPLALLLLTHHRSGRFNKIYSTRSLKKSEVENWPQITPVVSIDLIKQPLDQGVWAMSATPLEFCKKHQLLRVITKDDKQVYSINEGKAEKLFVLQMGPIWQGVGALSIYVKALLVIFVAHAVRDSKNANLLLNQISTSSAHGKLNFNQVEELLALYHKHNIILWLEKRHAYVGTLMASLLEIARENGVLASAEFLWLKAVDRRLWFLLNSVGRQTAVVEVAGLFSHWHAEKKIKRLLRTPDVKQAVKALENEANNILYVDEDETWRTSLVG